MAINTKLSLCDGKFSQADGETLSLSGTTNVYGCLTTTSFQIPTGAASGCVLGSDGSGNATWTTPSDGSGGDVTGTTAGVGANEIPVYQDTSGKLICTSNATIVSNVLTVPTVCGSTDIKSPLIVATTCINSPKGCFTSLTGGTYCGLTSITSPYIHGTCVCGSSCVVTTVLFVGTTTHICSTCVRSPLISGTTFATSSTSLVSNLNADLLDGFHASELTGGTGDVTEGSNALSGRIAIWGTPPSLDGDINLTWTGTTLTIGGSINMGTNYIDFDDYGSIFMGDSTKGVRMRNDGTYLKFDKGSATEALPFYITADIDVTYIYSPIIKLGSTSGTVIDLRGNSLTHNGMSISTAGTISTKTLNYGSQPDNVAGFDGYRVQVSATVKEELLFDGASLDFNFAYKVSLATVSTSTTTGYVGFVYSSDGSNWTIRDVSYQSKSSNNPFLEVDGGVVKILNAHASQYYTTTTIEKIVGGDGDYITLGGVDTMWSRIGNKLSYNDGNVGIGIDSPSTKLEVVGTITNQTINEPELGNAAINGGIIFNAIGSTFGGAIGLYDNGVGGEQYMWIQSRYTDSLNYRILALNPNGGNVGIGTDSPDAKLHVVGDLNVGGGVITNDSMGLDSFLTLQSSASVNSSEHTGIKFISDVPDRNAQIVNYRGTSSQQMGLRFKTYSGAEVVALDLSPTGIVTLSSLTGAGSRMVVTDANGLLSTQTIPTGAITISSTDYLIPFSNVAGTDFSYTSNFHYTNGYVSVDNGLLTSNNGLIYAQSSSVVGKSMTIRAGHSTASYIGGVLYLQGGNSVGDIGGEVIITGGNSVGGDGAKVIIKGGNATSSEFGDTGGSVNISGGAGWQGGHGDINLLYDGTTKDTSNKVNICADNSGGEALLVDQDSATGHGIFIHVDGTSSSYDLIRAHSGTASTVVAELRADGDWWANDYLLSSDPRLKNIYDTPVPGLETVLKFGIHNFGWKDKRDDFEHIGFLTTEMREIRPDLVKDGKEFDSISYSKITAINSAAIQDLHKIIEDLQIEIKELKNGNRS